MHPNYIRYLSVVSYLQYRRIFPNTLCDRLKTIGKLEKRLANVTHQFCSNLFDKVLYLEQLGRYLSGVVISVHICIKTESWLSEIHLHSKNRNMRFGKKCVDNDMFSTTPIKHRPIRHSIVIVLPRFNIATVPLLNRFSGNWHTWQIYRPNLTITYGWWAGRRYGYMACSVGPSENPTSEYHHHTLRGVVYAFQPKKWPSKFLSHPGRPPNDSTAVCDWLCTCSVWLSLPARLCSCCTTKCHWPAPISPSCPFSGPTGPYQPAHQHRHQAPPRTQGHLTRDDGVGADFPRHFYR